MKSIFAEIAENVGAEKGVALGTKLDDGFGEIAQHLGDAFETEKGTADQMVWVERNRELKGRPFSYLDTGGVMMLGDKDAPIKEGHRPYLPQLLNDRCREITLMKCRQSECTEGAINSNLWLSCTRPHTNVRHIFPTHGTAQRMALEKVTPAVDESPRIRALLIRPFSMQTKRFSNGSFYTIDASWTDFQGRGPSSDKLVFDEYESMNPKIEEIYGESLSHSKLALRYRLSTPLAPGGGIAEKFDSGCGFRWVVTCPKCGKEQVLSFPHNIINGFERGNYDLDSEEYMERLRRVYIGCHYCAAYIDRNSPQYLETAEWRAEKPSLVGFHNSYHLTYFQLPWKSAMEILYKFHKFRYVYQWRNEVLGEPAVGEFARVGKEVITSCSDPGFPRSLKYLAVFRNVSLGVDWGITSWVVVRANGIPGMEDKPYIVYVERIDDACLRRNGLDPMDPMAHAKRVEEIARLFRATILVNDANGLGKDRDTYLYRAFPGLSWACFYDTQEIQRQKRSLRTVDPRWIANQHRVEVSRVSTLKLLLQEYRDRQVAIARLDPDIEEYISHNANLTVMRMEDARSGEEYEVVGKTGPDHYAHAANYAKLGWDRITGKEAGNVSPGIILDVPGVIGDPDQPAGFDNIEAVPVIGTMDLQGPSSLPGPGVI